MVSIDRLRPAYTLADINEPQTQKVHNPVKEQEQSNPPSLIEEPSEDRENSAPKKSITWSGRRVRFPDRLQGGFSWTV